MTTVKWAYPAERIEKHLREKKFSEALQICIQYFAYDCYDSKNKDYLSRCILGSAINSFDGKVTPSFLDALLFSLRFGAVPEIAFSEFFPLYEAFLKQRYKELQDHGKVIFVLGTGRNGSTTIANALKRIPNSLVTHERPPIVYWDNAQRQLLFHLQFIDLSRKYFQFVIDASHWWLAHLHHIKESLSDFDVIFLHRNQPDTVRSFLAIKGTGRGSINHWTNHAGDYWTKNYWDECYPDVVDFSDIGESRNDVYMLKVQEDCIHQYVESYNGKAKNYVEANKGLRLNLETLFTNESKEQLFKSLDCEFEWQQQHLNVGGVQHSEQHSVFA